MSKEIISSNEIKPIGNPDQYFTNHDMLRGFCEEFLKNCSFVQHLWLLCSFPNLIPNLIEKTKHKINLKDLDFTKRDLHHSEVLRLLNNLIQLFPDIKKIRVFTRRFDSSVNDILRSFSSFKNLEDFDIVFDSVDTRNQLNGGFKSLKKLSITINRSKIIDWRKSKYLVHNILRFTSNLVNVELCNVLVDGHVLMALNYNKNLELFELINCKLEIGGRSPFVTFLNIRGPKKILIHELEDEENHSLIETLFNQIPFSNKLKELDEIAFNVYDYESIPYGNIKFCTNLKVITLTYFDTITLSFEKIFKELINTLRSMGNPFSLSISKVESETIINNDDSYNDIHHDFEKYIEDLDFYFESINFTTYPRIKHH